jgi:hypothetical protein
MKIIQKYLNVFLIGMHMIIMMYKKIAERAYDTFFTWSKKEGKFI